MIFKIMLMTRLWVLMKAYILTPLHNINRQNVMANKFILGRLGENQPYKVRRRRSRRRSRHRRSRPVYVQCRVGSRQAVPK